MDESVGTDDFRFDVEWLCRLLSDCVADLVVSLSMFEQAQIESDARMQARLAAVWERQTWEREGQRRREREAELEAQAGITWGQPDYFERSEAIREQVRRELLREKWALEGSPESYARRVVFIHAQSFVSTLAVQRSLLALTKSPVEPAVASGIKKAADEFAAALPGLKDVRDSVAHVEERVRGEVHGKKIKTQPVSNSLIHTPGGGAMVVSALDNQHYGCTIADGTYAEVEVADATTEVACAAVQAVYDALPWKPGHRHFEPSI